MTAPKRRNGLEIAAIREFEASRAASRMRACESKMRYVDEFVARAVGIFQMNKTAMTMRGEKLYIYKCKYCRGWHLTKRELAPYFAADYLEEEAYK